MWRFVLLCSDGCDLLLAHRRVCSMHDVTLRWTAEPRPAKTPLDCFYLTTSAGDPLPLFSSRKCVCKYILPSLISKWCSTRCKCRAAQNIRQGNRPTLLKNHLKESWSKRRYLEIWFELDRLLALIITDFGRCGIWRVFHVVCTVSFMAAVRLNPVQISVMMIEFAVFIGAYSGDLWR